MFIRRIQTIILFISILLICLFFIGAGAFFLIKVNFYITAEGVIEPFKQELIKSPVSGIIEEIYVNEGGEVDIDDEMFLIRGADLEENNEIVLEEYKMKKYIYDNLEKLYEKGIVSYREFLDAEKEYKIAKINKGKIEKTIVRAPLSGFIINNSELRLRKNDFVEKGYLLTKISDLNNYVVKAYVLEKDIYKIKTGQKSNIRIQGFSNYRSLFNGNVIKVMPEGKIENGVSIFEIIILLKEPITAKEYVKRINISPMMKAKVKIVYDNCTFFKHLLKEAIGDEVS